MSSLSAPSALAGVRVLELSSGHGAALAGHFLLGYGAKVVHVDPGGTVPLGPDVISYVHRGKTTRSLGDVPALLASVDVDCVGRPAKDAFGTGNYVG